jgi:hypothetical protein
VPAEVAPVRAFVAGLGVAIVIALVAAVVSDAVDLRSKDVYQSHNGSVRLSAQ